MESLRSALFVDFDNIFIGLAKQDPTVAERFGADPARWLAWLQDFDQSVQNHDRRILMRRCYLNPASFGRFRAHFVRAGFEVVDCPPLTFQGKTSADIHMVLDIIGALDHPTHFDEFIIFSGDADFTPLLVKLRTHDRRTMVMATSISASAYRAACDELLMDSAFVEEALGFRQESDTNNGSSVEALVDRVLQSLTLDQVGMASRSDATGSSLPPTDFRSSLNAFLNEMIGIAPEPIVSARVASAVKHQFAEELGDNWGGYKGFKELVASLLSPKFLVSWGVPGYFYDPQRHAAPSRDGHSNREIHSGKMTPQSQELARNISLYTETPLLSPEEMRDIFESIAIYLKDVPFHIVPVSKHLRDQFPDVLSRQDANFILNSIRYGGYDWGNHDNSHDARAMAECFARNVQDLATQIEWSESNKELLHEWVLGGFD